jgi:hypothetical protein
MRDKLKGIIYSEALKTQPSIIVTLSSDTLNTMSNKFDRVGS